MPHRRAVRGSRPFFFPSLFFFGETSVTLVKPVWNVKEGNKKKWDFDFFCWEMTKNMFRSKYSIIPAIIIPGGSDAPGVFTSFWQVRFGDIEHLLENAEVFPSQLWEKSFLCKWMGFSALTGSRWFTSLCLVLNDVCFLLHLPWCSAGTSGVR